MIQKVNNYTELCQKLKNDKGFMKANWCEGAECEDKIKEETGADIRLLIDKEKSNGECISCSKKTTTEVYFAKSY